MNLTHTLLNIMPLRPLLLRLTLPLTCVGLFTACDNVIYDDQGDCNVSYRLKISYDKNMKFADAYSAEVRRVHLFAHKIDTGEQVWDTTLVTTSNQEDYSINLPLKPGNYNLTAWCGASVDNGTQWNLEDDLGCILEHDGSGDISDNLNRLYHGTTNIELPQEGVEGAVYDYTLSLTKNTNTVRVVLQQLAGDTYDVEDFDIMLTADNIEMNYANKVIPSQVINYHAFQIMSSAPAPEWPSRGVTYPSIVAEITTGRLIKGNDVRLTVKDKQDDNKVIFSIPMIDYALLVKGNYDQPMTDQEYLDRQDEYNMVFFIDEGSRWLDSFIYVNSWMVVLQNTDI